MHKRWKKTLTWAFSLALTALLLYLFLWKADLRRVFREASEVHLGWLGLAVGFEVVSVYVRAMRWRLMLQTVRPKIPLSSLVEATVVSFTLSGVMPGRLGEVGRPFLLARRESLPFGSLLASVVLERGLDLCALGVLWFSFVLFGSSGLPDDADTVMVVFTRLSYVLFGAAVLFGLLFLWLVPRRRVLDRMVRRSERLGRYPFIQRTVRKVLGFAEGLGTFQRKRTLVAVTALSLTTWLLIAGSAWALFKGLGLDLPTIASVMLVVFVSFGAAIPTPGGIGGVHKAIQMALVLFYGVSEDTAVTAGIVGHAVMFFPGILWGLGYVALGRVGLGELKQVARASSDAGDIEETARP